MGTRGRTILLGLHRIGVRGRVPRALASMGLLIFCQTKILVGFEVTEGDHAVAGHSNFLTQTICVPSVSPD